MTNRLLISGSNHPSLKKEMYDQNSTIVQRRLPIKSITTSFKSRLPNTGMNFKRQMSGHIPQLKSQNSPLSNSTNLPQRSILETKNKRKINDFDDNVFQYDVPTSNYATVRKSTQLTASSNSGKRVKSEKVSIPKNVFPEDGSLRVVTSTIQGMKHWHNKHLSYPILFEVFGKLDSQVTTSSSTNSRQFSLIDENDRIECIFTEIDQTFSTIDRDIQLRLICRFDSAKNMARCINIRVAKKDEWEERRVSIRQSDAQLNDDIVQAKKSRKSSFNYRK